MTSKSSGTPTAKRFIERLKTYRSDAEREKTLRYFKAPTDGEVDEFIGVRMGQVFTLAKEFITMMPDEIEKLLESKIHEVRAGACSIMDKQARSKRTTPERRKELYDLYLRRHDRINNWDLVDVCAIHVVGGYLFDRPRKILYQLARSKNMWERRTAIVSTAYFIRKGELDDTYKIAEMLLGEKEDLVHKATGWMLRFAGDKDRPRLVKFLEQHGATMPRVALRYSIEHFEKKQRDYYLGLKKHQAKTVG
jgi:3-methyladenine DNA glycosylase AlkD